MPAEAGAEGDAISPDWATEPALVEWQQQVARLRAVAEDMYDLAYDLAWSGDDPSLRQYAEQRLAKAKTELQEKP